MAEISFTGGDKLRKHLEEIAKNADSAKQVRVGFLEDATYSDGTQVAYVAAIQNFGAPEAGIPPRPFFSNMVKSKSPNWGEELGNALKETGYNGKKSLEEMGDQIGSSLRESIIDTDTKALSPVTLMLRKMFGNHPEDIRGADVGEAARRVAEGKKGATGTQAHPLIWTGHMLNSIAYDVDGEHHKVNK